MTKIRKKLKDLILHSWNTFINIIFVLMNMESV